MSCTGPGQADHVVEFTAPAYGRYLFDASGSAPFAETEVPEGLAAVAVLDACGGAELACSSSALPAPWGGRAAVDLAEGQTVWAVVDLLSGDNAFVLEITEVPEVETSCADGIDEDADVAVDCIDRDCASAPNCAVTCPDDTLDLQVGTFTGTTIGLPDKITPSCESFPVPSPDQSLAFTPPSTGRYEFTYVDLPGSALVPSLTLTRGCRGVELACGGSTMIADLLGGVPVTVHTSGSFGTSGPYTLEVREVPAGESRCADGIDDDLDGAFDCGDADCALDATCQFVCPDLDLGATPGTIEGTTVGQPLSPGVSCQFAGPDVAVTQVSFTAPADGDYVFTSSSDAFAGALAVTDGCGGPELACDQQPDTNQVVVSLVAGQTVMAKVAAMFLPGGAFELTVQPVAVGEVGTCLDGLDGDADGLTDCADPDCAGVDPGCVEGCDTLADEDADGLTDCLDPDCAAEAHCVEACPQSELLDSYGTFQAVGTTVGAADDLAGSCGGAGASDVTYVFTAPATALYHFLPSAGIPDPRWYLLDGDCAGAELLCATDTTPRQVQLTAGDTVLVVLDGATAADDGEFVLTVLY